MTAKDGKYSVSIHAEVGAEFRARTQDLAQEIKSFLNNIDDEQHGRNLRSSSWWGFNPFQKKPIALGQMVRINPNDDIHDSKKEALFLKPWVFNPNHYLRQSWNVILVFGSILYTALRVPYAIAFDIDEFESFDGWFVINRIIDLIFIVDVTLIFLTGHKNGRKTIMDHWQIAILYLNTWFVFDFMASIPLDLIIWLASETESSENQATSRSGKLVRIIKVFRTLRILRLFKLQRVILSLQLFFGWNFQFVSIGKFLFAIALLAHLITCGFLAVGEKDGWLQNIADEPSSSQYLASFFWTITTMTTIGYGDIVAFTTNERIYSSFAMVLGAVTFTFCVTRIVHIMASMKKSQSMLVEQMENCSEWSQHHEFPLELEKRLKSYLRYRGSQTYFDENNVISGLSVSLRKKVLRHIYDQSLKKVDIFKRVSNEFLDELMQNIRMDYATPYSIILSEGSIGSNMYVIRRGVCAVYKKNKNGNKTQQNIVLLGRGQSFGETALIQKNTTRTASVVALEWTDLAVIERDTVVRLMEKYPMDQINIQRFTEHKIKSFHVGNEHPFVLDETSDIFDPQLQLAMDHAKKLENQRKATSMEKNEMEELNRLQEVFGNDPVHMRLQNMVNNLNRLQHKWLIHVKERSAVSGNSRRRSSIRISNP